MEKRVFLTVAICVGIFALWQRLYVKPYLDAQQQYQAQNPITQAAKPVSASGAVMTASATSAPKAAGLPSAQKLDITLVSKELSLTIATAGGVITETKVNPIKGKSTDSFSSLVAGERQLVLTLSSPELAYLSDVIYNVDSKSSQALHLSYEDRNVRVVRKYEFLKQSYGLRSDTEINFKKDFSGSHAFIELRTHQDIGKIENEHRNLVHNKSGGQDTFDVGGFSDAKEDITDTNWVGFSSRYFLNALMNTDEPGFAKPQFQAKVVVPNVLAARLGYKISAPTISISSHYYSGPKDIETLKAVGPKLAAAVDFGWFTFFAFPLLQGLKWFYAYVHNFGLAIILLTILVKIITYPLTYKSMKSMKDMQRIQPQLAKLREKYADDKEALNREMLQLMRANGYNPLSGCLPVLVQMPIFIALYNVLYNSIELYGQPFFGWIADLSQKDPYFVTPVLLALVMFIQQKMTPNTATDPAQQKMMTFMPVIFGAMMLWLPAGLTLYMLVNSVVSIAQQVLINKTIARAGA